MKKLAFLFVAVVAVAGFKVYAENHAIASEGVTEVPTVENSEESASLEPYMFMWSKDDNDCVSGSKNYCTCE